MCSNFTSFNHLAPLCPLPVEIPFEGKRENNPKVFEMEHQELCGVDDEVTNIKCSTFENVHITKALYGREKLKRDLCDGKTDKKVVQKDCLKDVTTALRDECGGKSFCAVPVNGSLHGFEGDCDRGQRNVLDVKYLCGRILRMNYVDDLYIYFQLSVQTGFHILTRRTVLIRPCLETTGQA